MAAGADAATQMDAAFRKIIDNDPEIQAVIKRVWGEGQRPSDTPKNLEKANAAASKEIGSILARKGIELPDRTFINPRSGTIEGHRGWSGLSGIQKAVIIAAAAAATGGAGLALAGGGGIAGGVGGAAGAAGAGGGAAGAALPVVGGLGGLTLGAGSAVPLAAGIGGSALAAGAGGGALAASPGVTAGMGGLSLGAGSAVPVGGAATGTSLLSKLGGYGKLAETAGTIASGIGQNAAAERSAGIDYGLLRDKLGLTATGQAEAERINRADLDMRQRLQDASTRKNAFTDSMRASLIQNWQSPTLPKGVPNISLGGQGFGTLGGQAADELGRQAMIKLVQGEKFDKLPDYQPYQLSSPTQMPGASATEKIADLIGLGGTAVGGYLNRNDQTNNMAAWEKLLRER